MTGADAAETESKAICVSGVATGGGVPGHDARTKTYGGHRVYGLQGLQKRYLNSHPSRHINVT